MIHYTYEMEEGCILPLSQLEGALREISVDYHHWEARVLSAPFQVQDGVFWPCVEMTYSNPDEADRIKVPNLITFVYPLIKKPDQETLKHPVVCLHPASAIAVREGVYFEKGNQLFDPIEDFSRFWRPVASAVEAALLRDDLPRCTPALWEK